MDIQPPSKLVPPAASDAPEEQAPAATPPAPKPATPETNSEPELKAPSHWKGTLSTIAILLIAPIIAILLTAFVFQSYQVDGVSMQNTLQNNDRLIIWKVPRTWARITGHQYVPKRGDIIIVSENNLEACGQSESRQIVKRVIGLPGERVVFNDGHYTIYNTEHPKGFDPDKTLPYGKTGTPLFEDQSGTNVDVTLDDHHIFVSGDHRADSCDSRALGPVNTDQIVGKLALRLLPLSKMEKF